MIFTGRVNLWNTHTINQNHKYNTRPTSIYQTDLTPAQKALWSFFMDVVKLPKWLSPEIPGCHLIGLEWWKAESTLESPSGFEHRTLDWESSTITPPLRNYALRTYKDKKYKKHGMKFKEWVHQLCYNKYYS